MDNNDAFEAIYMKFFLIKIEVYSYKKIIYCYYLHITCSLIFLNEKI